MPSALRHLALVLFGALAPALAFAGDPVAGQAHFAVCQACHGVSGEGNPDLKAPAIGGQEVWYVERQLLNFRGGVRGASASKDPTGATMAPMAASLPDAKAVADVAAYVGSLPTSQPAVTLGGDPAKGAATYATCSACHGPDAAGQEALGAPSLRIQQDWYVLAQLQAFRKGVRGTHPKDAFGATMKPMADMLTDDQAMRDVIAYIFSLR